MAKSLGVKIKVDYSDIDKLEKKLDQLTKDKLDININLDTKKALNKLTAFEDKFNRIKKTLESGLDLKINTNNLNVDKIFDNLKQNGKEVSNVLENATKESGNLIKSLNGSDSVYSKLTKSFKIMSDGSSTTKTNIDKIINSLQKESTTYTNGAKSAQKVTEDRASALKEIASIVKEIGSLEQAQIGNDSKSRAAIQKRIDLLNKEKTELSSAFKTITGSNADDSSIVKQTQALSDYKTELKKVAQEKADQSQVDKETKSILSQIVDLENKKYSLISKAQNVGSNESSALLKQADALQDQTTSLIKQSDLFSRITVEQAQSLNLLTQQNQVALEYAQTMKSAKQADKEKAAVQKNTLSQLKSDYKQIVSLQEKIVKLEADKNAGVISGKDSQNLDALKRELEFRDQNFQLMRRQAQEQGNLTSEQDKYLSSIQKESTYKMESAQKTAEINADLAKSAQLYNELETSIKTVHSLKEKMASAGEEEAEVIRKIISLEEQRQNAIQETLTAEKRVNSEKDNELSDLKKQTAELEKQNSERKEARSLDKANTVSTNTSSSEKNVGILGDLLNPRAIWGDVQQAAMTIYNSMASIDEQLVNIAKVADVPNDVLENFAATIYDTASTVGKSAEEYGVSVERWVTAGKTLSESTELAKTSVMGAFVGNIDEADMVDYMSVPLNAYKKDALEATDIINSMNEVANQNAIEMDDMGKAYKRAASTSAQTGTSFAELTGLITAGQEATRVGGESVGNAIKAMDVNFGKISSKLTNGDENKYNFFKNIGVSIKDSEGNLRSTFDILSDLHGVWDNLSDTDKSTAGFYSAGKNFQNVFSGILGSWDSVTKATSEAQGQLDLLEKTSGSAYKEFEKQQDSIEFKAAALKNSWAEFLNVVAGGKDGLSTVMDALNKGLQQATDLAKDPAVRELAINLAKVLAVMTGVTVANKFFETITRGSLGALSGVSKITKSIGLLDKAGKLPLLSKGVGLFKGALGFGTKLIPVVGGIITALEILDVMGVPVWETLADGVKKVNEYIHSGKKEIKDYAAEQEKASKALDSNKILNGEIEKTNEVIKSYEDLRNAKQKAYKETGDKNKLTYSEDEFNNIKSQFNTMAEALGLDVRITMNNYDDIEAKYQQLLKYKEALSSDEAVDLAENLNKKSSYSENQGKYDEYSTSNKVHGYEETEKYWQKYLNSSNEALKKQAEEAIEKTKSYVYDYGFFDSKDMQKAEKENTKRLKELEKTRSKLADSAQAGTLQEGFASMDSEDQEKTIALLSSELPLINKNSKAYDSILKKVKDKKSLTLEEQNQLKLLSKDYQDLSDKTGSWSEETRQSVMGMLESSGKTSKETTKDLENSIKQLGEIAGLNQNEINSMIDTSKKGGRDLLDLMSEYGDMGASVLGITNRIMAQAEINGITWQEMAKNIQDDVDQIPDEKQTKYNLVQENGVANWDVIDNVLNLPREIVTDFKLIDDSGNIDVSNVIKMLDEMPEDVKTKFNLDVDKDGTVQVEEIIESWKEMDEEQKIEFITEFTGDTSDVDAKTEEVKKKTSEASKAKGTVKLTAEDLASPKVDKVTTYASKIKDGDYTAMLKANGDNAETKVADVQGKLGSYNLMDVSARLDADNQDALIKYGAAHGVLVTFDSEMGEASFKGEKSNFDTVASQVDDRMKPRTATMSFVAQMIGGVWDTLTGWLSGKSGTVSISAKASKSGSAAIGTQLGSSFSASVGSQITGQSSNTSISKSTSTTSSSKNAKVDSDVWRYWAKELFQGLPLENSMDALEKAITNAGENQDKLISLYKQQNTLLNKQITYQSSLKNSQQSEMNSILSQLRKYGFKTSGNQITNLSKSKSFSGDKATTVNDLLSDWKSLYESIDGINDTIKDLKQTQLEIKQTIKDANIEKEAKKIESSLKKSEALLTAIENSSSIQSNKESLVNDSDYELSLSVKEQGLNTSSSNMSKLIDEYNRLAKASVNYAENAEDVQSQLSSIKSNILENADAILEYREELSSIRIDRLIGDYEKFTDVIQTNIDSITNSIDNLKDGLISGSSLSDLVSSDFSSLDLNRKSKLAQDQQERLKLEAELDAALDAYGKKNIDRVTKIANATLTIEKNKYNSLSKMASDYSNGKAISVTTATRSSVDFGLVSATNSDKEYAEWKKRLLKVNDDYSKAYAKLVSDYDKAVSSASGSSIEDLTNQVIIDQLKLQEKMQQEIINLNNEMIKQSQEELKNTSLTTEQRETLQNAIEEYKQSSIDAQNSIKDSIADRYEFEFDLLDQASDKAQKYVNDLDHLLSIADLTNLSSSSKSSLYDAIYQAKVNQYNNAKSSLEELKKEQDEFTKGSYEWNLLQEKIEEVNTSLQDYTLDVLNANKDILANSLDAAQETLEKGILGGKTLDEWKDYQDNWVNGISKEIALESLRTRLLSLEDDNLNKRLELLDRQEAVSQVDLDYMDKQAKVLELQQKLSNIEKERTVQTLVRNDDGSWGWQYVADQTEYDKTKEDLSDAQKELDEFTKDQREKYASALNDVIEKAKNGDYKNSDELQNALSNVNSIYGNVINDTPGVNTGSIADIIAAYDKYVKDNGLIVDSAVNNSQLSDTTLQGIGAQFETSFKNISEELGSIIGNELKNALIGLSGSGSLSSYSVQIGSLEFPNVKDTTGMEEFFKDLPSIVDQFVYKK